MKIKKIFNLQHGVLGFINMGVLAFVININFGTFSDSLWAGLIQGLITFLVVGLNTAFFQFLYSKYDSKVVAIFLPTFFTTMLSFVVHQMNNSPSPIGTAIGVFIVALINFLGLTLIMNKTSTIKPTKLVKILWEKVCFIMHISRQ